MKQNIFTRLLCLFMALFSLSAFADNAPIPVLPTSPQAESIKRYGELDFDYSIGTPNISIPLFDIDHRGYKVPVKLQYIPSPLKPGYNYDVYGHGWNLSINSCISRRINYEPDETSNFALETDQFSNIYRTHGSGMMNYNLAYDPFSVTLPDGTAFDFYIVNRLGTVEYIVSNGRYVQISHTTSNSQIASFTITDEQGIVYTFAGADASFQGMGATNSGYINTYVSWSLTNIKLPNSNENIRFVYDKTLQSHYATWVKEPTSSFKHINYVNTPDEYYAQDVAEYNCYAYQMKLLTQISYGTTTVDFTYTKSDAITYNNHISTITLKDYGTVVRKFQFGITDQSFSYPNNANDILGFLYSVTAQGPDSSEEGMTYRCEYQAKNSFNATDHWGNLNYQPYTSQVAFFNFFCDFDFENNIIYRHVPMTLLENDSDELAPYQKIRLTSMNTDPRLPASPNTHGVIKRLIYPTGGYTEFVFENHRFYTHTDSNGDYIHDEANRRIIEGGGFRISEVRNYTSNGSLSDSQYFRYGKSSGINSIDHSGAGEPVVDPNVLTYLGFNEYRTNTSIRNMVLGLSPQGQQTSFTNPFDNFMLEGTEWGYECVFSAQNFRRLLNGRQAVVYPEVTVYYGNPGNSYYYQPQNTTGKAVYYYDIDDVLAQDTSFFEKPTYHGNVLSYRAKKYRYANLIKKEEYRYKNESTGYWIAREEDYEWAYSANGVNDYIYNNSYFLDFVSPTTSLGSFFSNHYTDVGKAYLKHKSVRDYGSVIYSVLKREGYNYNTRNQVTEIYKGPGIHNEYEVVRYTYPELSGDASSSSYKMAQQHIFTPILNQHTQTNLLGDYTDMSGVKTDYAAFSVNSNTRYLPSKLYKLDANSGTYLLDKEIVSYASQCNPQEVIGSDGVRTIYLWSYNNRYLIAEIRNATLSQVTSAVSAVFGTTISGLGNSSSPSASGLQALHANNNLSNALVTTYTHKPLVGVTSITDPSGRTTYYDYDGLGRLKEAYYYEGGTASTANKRVLEANEYHYVNQ
ncbi:MAG: hypothetical protein E7098_10730 [Mediterranea massiliensis]|nr:hypothetical protein [Mediterranea massiliensis]